MFYVIISESFKRFQYLNFETNFLENKHLFQKTRVFQLKPLRLKTHHFHSKLLCQKQMLRPIEWRLQNGPITKSLIFLENLFQFQNLLKRVNLMYNDPNVNILIFHKHQSLILGCFFLVSILKYFIRYNDNDVIRPLCIKLPQMIGYVRKFGGNTSMSFKISNKQLLTKGNQI